MDQALQELYPLLYMNKDNKLPDVIQRGLVISISPLAEGEGSPVLVVVDKPQVFVNFLALLKEKNEAAMLAYQHAFETEGTGFAGVVTIPISSLPYTIRDVWERELDALQQQRFRKETH